MNRQQAKHCYVLAGMAVIHAVCFYEPVAMHVARLPTLTYQHYRHLWRGRMVLAFGLGWLSYHLCLEDRRYPIRLPTRPTLGSCPGRLPT